MNSLPPRGWNSADAVVCLLLPAFLSSVYMARHQGRSHTGSTGEIIAFAVIPS